MTESSDRPLTKPQQTMLDDLQNSPTGGLWIRHASRWSPTIRVLLERGLIEATDRAGRSSFYEVKK